MASFVRIPNNIIVDQKINSREFMLYAVLRWKLELNEDKITFDEGRELKQALRWKDTRTISKYLKQLEKKGHIEILEGYRANTKLEIRVETYPKDSFTQIPSKHFREIYHGTKEVFCDNSVKDIADSSLRLYYFYEKNYNYELKKAFPSYKTINKTLGISYAYVSCINKTLERLGVLVVKEGDVYNKMDEEKVLETRKTNNSYIPLIENRV